MAIISKESFEKLKGEEKEKLRQIYKDMKEEPSLVYAHEYAEKCEWLEDYFGKESLQLEPKIKTWEDVLKYNLVNPLIISESAGYAEDVCGEKIGDKVESTLKIAKLIEFGYGGIVTDEEWKKSVSYNQEDIIWTIVCEYNENKELQLRVAANWSQPEMVSFHTKQQAEEFMSYPENRKLVEQYYMI